MGKFVVFSNIKGGVGKTTLCIAFAHYLVSKGESVQVLDADIQKSVVSLRAVDLKKGEKSIPWDVVSSFDIKSDGDVSELIPAMKDNDGWIIVDCPGNLESDRLAPLFEAADALVIPLSYSLYDVDATLEIFAPVIRKINGRAKFIFVPNRISDRCRKGRADLDKARQEAIKELNVYGSVTPKIKDSIVLSTSRLDTVHKLDERQAKAVVQAFDSIMTQIEN